MRAPDERRHAELPQTDAVLPHNLVNIHRDSIITILARHGMTNPRLFGSVARLEDSPGSDVDLLVDAADDLDLLDLVEAAEALVPLGVHVGIVTSRPLHQGHEITEAAVPL